MKITSSLRSLLSITLILLVSIHMVSCNNDDEPTITQQEEVKIMNESSSAENTIDEELQTIEAEMINNPDGGRSSGTQACVVVTRDPEAKTVILDFGEGCVGPYGRERSGKIIITYSGTFGDHKANRVISFDNYFVNNKQITGTIELRDYNTNNDGNLTATRERNDLTVHFPDGNTFTVNGSTTITWLEGFGNLDPADNVFEVTGSYTGVSSRGRTVTHQIITPLKVNVACGLSGNFARVSGEIEVVIEGGNRERNRTIQYGDGTCDDSITVIVNGKTFQITLS